MAFECFKTSVLSDELNRTMRFFRDGGKHRKRTIMEKCRYAVALEQEISRRKSAAAKA